MAGLYGRVLAQGPTGLCLPGIRTKQRVAPVDGFEYTIRGGLKSSGEEVTADERYVCPVAYCSPLYHWGTSSGSL